MSAQDWYARHLGKQAPQAPAAPPQSPYYGQQAPAGYQVPAGYQLVPVAPQQDAGLAAYGIAGGGVGGHADPWAEPPPPPVDTARIPKGAINAQNFLQVAGLWRGGQGRKQAQHCPRCDGVLFRRFEGQREAAPLCTGCGWNGLWEQGEHSHAGAV